jgi:hypothetical protein
MQTCLTMRNVLDGTGDVHPFGVIIMQMGDDVGGTLKSYWLAAKQFCYAIVQQHSNIMKYDHFCYVSRFLHFTDSMKQPDENNNCDAYTNFTLHLNI